MRRYIIISAVAVFLLFPLTQIKAAFTPTNIGRCQLSTSISDEDHVKVFRVLQSTDSEFLQLSMIQREYARAWEQTALDRYYNENQKFPRCDEFQFHLDHNTPEGKLKAWLVSVEKTRIDGLEGQTASDHSHKMWFIQNGQRHRIYDWPTAMSWGLLVEDRYSISESTKGYFYEHFPEGTLNYWEGPWFKKVDDVMRNGNLNQDLPQRLLDRLEKRSSWWLRNQGPIIVYTRPYSDLYDFSYLFNY